MIDLRTIEFISSTVTIFLLYGFLSTIVGYFVSWVALQMGDDTPTNFGFLTFNPAQHFDLIGFACLALLGFGWFKQIPINSVNIRARYGIVRVLKLLVTFYSGAFLHIIIGSICIALLLVQFGGASLVIANQIIHSGRLSHELFAQFYPQSSSIAITYGLLLVGMVYLNLIFAILDFVFMTLRLFMSLLTEEYPQYLRYDNIFTSLIYVTAISIFVLPQLGNFLTYFIFYWGQIIAHLIKLLPF